MMTQCDVLAELASSIRYETLPQGVVTKTKSLILDSVGCMVGGTGLDQGRQISSLFGGLGGIGQARIACQPGRVPVLSAAYVNSYLANLLDYDDTFHGHPGATTVPPALAVAESGNASGQELIAAVAAGYEVGARVCEAIIRSPSRDQEVSGFTWQVFNAAAAAGRAMGLDLDALSHCLSLAGYHAPVPFNHKLGLSRGNGAWTKNNYGWFSAAGVTAALLSREGFRGNKEIFDGEKGFWLMAGSDQYDPSRLSQGLEGGYAVEKIHLKPYTTCRYFHPTLDAVKLIVRQASFAAEDIARIEVSTFYKLQEGFLFFPTDLIHAPFSLPYAVALQVLQVPDGVSYFDRKWLQDPQVREIAGKVRVENWTQADERFRRGMRGGLREMIARVRITLQDGAVYEEEVLAPRGSPKNPLTGDELRSKFLALVEPIIGETPATRLVCMISSLEELPDVRQLTDLLVRSA